MFGLGQRPLKQSKSALYRLCLQSRNVTLLKLSTLLSAQRATLMPTTIEQLKCLKSWFRLSIFTEEDLHNIVDTMGERATEALKEALDDEDEASELV